MALRRSISLIFLIITLQSLAKDHPRKLFKPLKYLLHKPEIETLIYRFDSIANGQAIGIGLSTRQDEIRIINYNKQFDILVNINTLPSADTLQASGLSLSQLIYIKQTLEKTGFKSIKRISNTTGAVELISTQNLISDNCRGFIFVKNKADLNAISAGKYINPTTLYCKHLSYL